jgi:hypothetical protein
MALDNSTWIVVRAPPLHAFATKRGNKKRERSRGECAAFFHVCNNVSQYALLIIPQKSWSLSLKAAGEREERRTYYTRRVGFTVKEASSTHTRATIKSVSIPTDAQE